MNLSIKVCALTAALVLAGCGGGGGGGGGTSASLVGTFIDSPVSGLEYASASGSGITDANGRFTYKAGESVTFRIGKLVIGTAVPDGTGIVTPLSLVDGATDANHPRVELILRTLQSLDSNNDPDDGIQISDQDRETLAQAASELDLEDSSTDEDAVESFLGQPLTVSSADAKQHFNNSLYSFTGTGRLLASNCFQCHGTNGSGGFDRLSGESADSLYNELREFALKSGSDAYNDIMAAHAKGYTDAQMRAIATYLANVR